jgi:ABC-type polysaccharide/polyol phosphate export permease
MSRKNKKRNKPYTGADAVQSKPVVHHYVAVERSAFGEWWQAHKTAVRYVSIIAAVILIVGWLLFELFRLVF